MTDTISTHLDAGSTESLQTPILTRETGNQRVGNLLAGLQASSPRATEADRQPDAKFENQLALVRLGMATSLFYALRTKHGPTAAHCLRVAISCSAWAQRMGLDEATRDRIEVAALLHDLGKIGIPDRILRKPGQLSVDEQLSMDCCAQLGCEILRGCTNDNGLLEIVRYANTWFDSRRHGEGPRCDALPLGSRMLAISDAFDAMTTDSVYRSAMSRERAIQELIDGSGTQFDPELALDFNRMLEDRPEMLQSVIIDRWLQQLKPGSGNDFWGNISQHHAGSEELERGEGLYFRQLINHMKDAVAFTDTEGTILEWNSMMHRLTSIPAESMVGQTWTNECIGIREQDGAASNNQSLVHECLDSAGVVARPMMIEQPESEPTPVHVHVSPVTGPKPGIHGTVIIIRDLSDQANMEEKLESLHQQNTRDALTGVANRAHFDNSLEKLTASCADGGSSFSLIICDIDHFKRVNDLHGHPAGDAALVSFASILSMHSREEDLVARYGGEEFLLLAPNCDNATAARRAEAIRLALEQTLLPSLGGEAITASFGVTEFQSGDTDATVLARADRALLKAKDNGRNRVIQLGSGSRADLSESNAKRGWLSWFNNRSQSQDREFDIVTPVPIDLAIEKLRGFIADHQADIIAVDENHVTLRLRASWGQGGRRRIDHQIALRVELTFSEFRLEDRAGRAYSKTKVHVSLQPVRNRDRRDAELSTCFMQVMASLRCYLIGEIQEGDDE